jgi:hypothetical protein
VMVHGMNAWQQLDPPYRQSETKVIAAAKQLLTANPKIQNLYTIGVQFAPGIYASGEFFQQNPQCALHDKDGKLVNISVKFDSTHQNCNLGDGNTTRHCYVYGFDTECGRKVWCSCPFFCTVICLPIVCRHG